MVEESLKRFNQFLLNDVEFLSNQNSEEGKLNPVVTVGVQYKRIVGLGDIIELWRKINPSLLGEKKETISQIIESGDIFNLLKLPYRELDGLLIALNAIRTRKDNRLFYSHLEILLRIVDLFCEQNTLTLADECLREAEQLIETKKSIREVTQIKFSLTKANLEFYKGNNEAAYKIIKNISQRYKDSFWENLVTLPLQIRLYLLNAKIVTLRREGTETKSCYLDKSVSKCLQLVKLCFKKDKTSYRMLIKREEKYRIFSLSLACLRDYIKWMINTGNIRYTEAYLTEAVSLSTSLCLPLWLAEFLNLRVKFELFAHRFKSATITLRQLEYTFTTDSISNVKSEKSPNNNANISSNSDLAVRNQPLDEYDQEDSSQSEIEEISVISRPKIFKPDYLNHDSCCCNPCCDVFLQSVLLNYYYNKVEFSIKKLKKREVLSYLQPLAMIFHSTTTKGVEIMKSVLDKANKYDNIEFHSSISTLMYHESLIKLNLLHLKTAWLFRNAKRFKSYIRRTEKLVKLQKYTFLLCNEYEGEALYYKAIAVFPELKPLRIETLERNIIKEENFKRLLSPTLNRLRTNAQPKRPRTPKTTNLDRIEKVTCNMKREIKEEMTFNVDLDNDDFLPSPILGYKKKQSERKRRRLQNFKEDKSQPMKHDKDPEKARSESDLTDDVLETSPETTISVTDSSKNGTK
ncbi:DgyrCDS12428 [Dimorphilus gyrociliatus]|uniref:DgyrCDS12428 n=1 Tax=Dimorphilus gyrociliatus TaxID=2664684 RepID=A0A7I8W7Y4_9ANNE|nr:DgyrCDS12428 [Dimorphilus gyrociliatus]